MANPNDIFAPNPAMDRWLTPTVLVVANLLPIAGVLFWTWDIGAIVTLYWAENLAIGAITILRMLRASFWAGLGVSAFFLIHYGGFTGVHGMFLVSIFEIGDTSPFDDLSWPFFFVFVEMLARVTETIFSNAPQAWLLAAAMIATSHLVSFFYHVVMKGEDDNKASRDLMTSPYGRVVVLHVAIIAGGFAVAALGSTIGLLLVLVVLKIILDLTIHKRRHKLV